MRKIERIIIKEYTKYINEYVTNKEISLLKYLGLPKSEKYLQIAELYPQFVEQYLIEMKYFNNEKYWKTNIRGLGDDEILKFIKDNKYNIFQQYGKWIYDNIVEGDNKSRIDLLPQEKPAWRFFDGDGEIIKNQWLLHFTNNAVDIANDGFRFGVPDINKLGLTVFLDDLDKIDGGYNFAFTIDDYKKYGKSFGKFKYGGEAVLFRSSGVRVWNNNDEEYQTVFYGNLAKDIIPIIKGEKYKYGVYSIKKDRIIYQNDDFDTIVEWCVNNINQYRKLILK